jgi:hypothetical protein
VNETRTEGRTNDDAFDFHIVRVEVTVAAAIQQPDGQILGDNMVDATLAFGWRLAPPPEGVSDAAVNAALAKHMSPVLALIQTALTFNGWVAMGATDEPMNEKSSPTGEFGKSSPVTVRVSFPDETAAVHD